MKKNILIIGILVTLFATAIATARFAGFIRLKAPQQPTSACTADDGHGHAKTNAKVKDAHEKDDDHGDEKAPPVHLTPEQAKLIKVKITETTTGNIDNTLVLNGEIRLNMDETAKIMPRLPGFVTKVLVKEGDVVKNEQLLALLTSHKLGEYYSAYNSATELEKLTRSEFTMAENLRAKNAMSEKEFFRYKREYADATITCRRAEALLKSLLLDPAHNDHRHDTATREKICTEYEIKAPFDGTVIAKNITVGENFPEDNSQVLFTISNMKKLWLDLRADSNEMKMLKAGMSVTAKPSNSHHEFHGRIVYLAPMIDEATRTGLVRVLIDNTDGTLRPGEFATGTIRPESGSSGVIVPREAVQLIAGETIVFVPQGDGFAPKLVSVGKSAQGFSQILSGLKVGARYVSAGAFELKSVLLTSGMDPHAGHGH